MPALVAATGWILSLMSWCWIVLIFIKTLAGWLSKSTGPANGLGLGFVAEAPVNWVRRLMPTVYRSMDVAPWLTILLLILLKTFVFRAMLYWGMLNRPPGS